MFFFPFIYLSFGVPVWDFCPRPDTVEEHENVCGAQAVKEITLKSFNSVSNSRHIHSKTADNMFFSEYPLKNKVEFPKGEKKHHPWVVSKQAFCSNSTFSSHSSNKNWISCCICTVSCIWTAHVYQSKHPATMSTATCAATGVLYNSSSHIHIPIHLFVHTLSVTPVCTRSWLKIDLGTYDFPVTSKHDPCGHSRFWLHLRQGEVNIAQTKFRAPHFPAAVVLWLATFSQSSGSVSLEDRHHA